MMLPVERRPQGLRDLREALDLEGLYYLATCQRVLTAFFPKPGAIPGGGALRTAMARVCQENPSEAVADPETHRGKAALHHLARVAAAFESFVPGEPQVLGQFKEAYNLCAESGLLTTQLAWILQRVIHAAKRVRTETDFFAGKVSTLPLALDILRLGFDGAGRAAVVGSGKMGTRMAALLSRRFQAFELHVVSRSLERGAEWARECDATGWRLDAFLRDPPALDALILAGEARRPFLTVDVASRFLEASRNGGLTVLDLALPRNCEAEVGNLPGVRLVQMDDLAREAERGRAVRSRARVEAGAVLKEEVEQTFIRARRRERDYRIGRLQAEIVDTGKRRLDALPPALQSLGSDPVFLKWYEQSLKAVAHVSLTRTREVVEEVQRHGDD